LLVRFPPATAAEHAATQGIDVTAANQEFFAHFPGLAALMEAEHPGMHASHTVDYGVVLSGEVELELDEGVVKRLTAGNASCKMARGMPGAIPARSTASWPPSPSAPGLLVRRVLREAICSGCQQQTLAEIEHAGGRRLVRKCCSGIADFVTGVKGFLKMAYGHPEVDKINAPRAA
jgi:hypothetical protein